MCVPGTYAAAPQSPACGQCPPGTYADSWGSTHCNHCIIGTYTPYQVSAAAPLIPASPQVDCNVLPQSGFRVQGLGFRVQGWDLVPRFRKPTLSGRSGAPASSVPVVHLPRAT